MDLDKLDFKPLTEGLGFDKQTAGVKASVAGAEQETVSLDLSVPTQEPKKRNPDVLQSLLEDLSEPKTTKRPNDPLVFDKPKDWLGKEDLSSSSSREIADMIDSLPPSLDFSKSTASPGKTKTQLFRPLEKKPTAALMDFIEDETSQEAKKEREPNVGNEDVSLNNTLEKAFPSEGFRRPFFQQTVEVKAQYTPISANFTSAIIDFLVISGFSTLLIYGVAVAKQGDIIGLLMNSPWHGAAWQAVAAIYMAVYFVYYIASRGLWGSSLGDWAFDVELGTEDQQGQWSYPFRVITRMFFVALTGFVLLPLLSVIFRMDLAHGFCGLKLYERNY